MSSYLNSKSAYAGLISIVSIYILLIVLILIFANEVILEISSVGSLSSLIFIPLALVLPIFLISTIVYKLIKLIREKQKKRYGSNFKIKLLIFFTFITILSSLPQGVLAVNFINTVIKSWYSSGVEDALKGGLDIAIEYNRSTMENLAIFRDSLVFENIVQNPNAPADRVWNTIKGAFPGVNSLIIFDNQGNRICSKSTGDKGLNIDFKELENGKVSRFRDGTRTVIGTRKDFFHTNPRFSAVLTVLLPENFDFNAGNMTNAIQRFIKNRELEDNFLIALILFYTYFSLPIILLSILTSFLLSEEIIQPIAHLEEAIHRVIKGDYTYRILTHSKDDLSNLVNSFNYMVSELELSRNNLAHTEKVTAWQEIAQRMAHEIKNPLTPIKLSAQRILKKYKSSPESMQTILEPAVDVIIKEVDNLTELLSQFKDFARMPTPVREEIHLKNLISEVSLLYSEVSSNITLDLEGIGDIILKGDRNQIQRVFSNLICNSYESIKESGSVTIRTEGISKGNTYYCRISVTDTGSGIDPDLKKEIFNPYFTTKEGGTGLGLPIVERIVADHKGKIWYESEINVGTTFFIEIPMEEAV